MFWLLGVGFEDSLPAIRILCKKSPQAHCNSVNLMENVNRHVNIHTLRVPQRPGDHFVRRKEPFKGRAIGEPDLFPLACPDPRVKASLGIPRFFLARVGF